MYKFFFKRLFDLLLAFTGIVLIFPIFFLITLLLIVNNNGKPFFLQPRPGKNGKVFKVIKFKSMNDKKDIHGALLPFNERVTKFGNFLRVHSLDEIPQLLNILKGDMSLIGPRPLLVKYLPLYSEEQSKRHQVKPGITGWAQVNGRNAISWKQKFEFDIWYINNISLAVDIKIIIQTIKKVINRDGINSGTTINMEAFNGNN